MTKTEAFDPPIINKSKIEEIVSDFLIEEIGTIPNVGEIKEKDNMYTVSVEAKYPKTIFDPVTKHPLKLRYLNLGPIETVVVDGVKGEIVEKFHVSQFRKEVKEKLNSISIEIEKALVKVGASNFAQIPFASHRHTPMYDILAWIVVNGSMNLNEELMNLSDDDQNKYRNCIELLERLSLVEIEEDILIPGNILYGFEKLNKPFSDTVCIAMEYVYKEGYEFIDSIRNALGSYLILSHIIYGPSIELGELVDVGLNEIEQNYYATEGIYELTKRIKVPRYLIQLEDIGLIEYISKNGAPLWRGTEEKFDSLMREDMIQQVRKILA